MKPSIGFIGIGVLADYLVKGIRHAGDDRQITLSPRGKDNAQALSAQFDLPIAADNQGVVDVSDMVVLSTKPEHAEAAVTGLCFREGQILLSVVAGLPCEVLQPLVEPAMVVRALPLIGTQVGVGGTPIYPANASVEALLSAVSTIIVFDDEPQYELAAVSGCLNGWVYGLVAELQSWLESKGFEADKARTLAIESFDGATSYAKHFPALSLQGQADHIGQPGTFTKTVIDAFEASGGNQALRDACEAVHDRLTSRAETSSSDEA